MGKLLQKIFEGGYFVNKEEFEGTDEYQTYLEQRKKLSEQMQMELGTEWQKLDKWQQTNAFIRDMAECEAFRKGFGLAVRLMAEALMEQV